MQQLAQKSHCIRRLTLQGIFMHTDAIDPSLIAYDELLPAGGHWSMVVAQGWTLRLTDLQGGANVSALFFNQDDKRERYCMAETLKAQHTAYLTQGLKCYSVLGREMMSIAEDTCGYHDTICGTTTAALIDEKFYRRGASATRSGHRANGRDDLLWELARWGLDGRNLVGNINFFSRLQVDKCGRSTLAACAPTAGERHVDLQAQMNVLTLLSATPHPFHEAGEYPRGPVRMTVWRADGCGRNGADACFSTPPVVRAVA